MKEIRSIEEAEFRILPDSRKIEGYALLFNSYSNDLGGFTEIISPTALNGVLERSDILALFNHDDNKVLARNTKGKGTLTLEVDNKGLKYSFSAPKTPIGDELFDAINRGDLRNSSFAFTVQDSGSKWERDGNKTTRTITQFDKLFDVSPVWKPAYSDTSVAVRSFNEFEHTWNDVDKPITIDIAINGSDLVAVLNNANERAENVDEPIETDIPVEPNDPECEPEEVIMITITYNGNDYVVPLDLLKEILEDEDDERKLKEYYKNLEDSIIQLKK